MSLTLISLFVGAITLLAQKAGVDIAPESIQTTIETIIMIGSAIGVWYGRFRQGDINVLGVKEA